MTYLSELGGYQGMSNTYIGFGGYQNQLTGGVINSLLPNTHTGCIAMTAYSSPPAAVENPLTSEERISVLERLLELVEKHGREWVFSNSEARLPDNPGWPAVRISLHTYPISRSSEETKGITLSQPVALATMLSNDADKNVAAMVTKVFDAFHDCRHQYGNHELVKALKDKLGVVFNKSLRVEKLKELIEGVGQPIYANEEKEDHKWAKAIMKSSLVAVLALLGTGFLA